MNFKSKKIIKTLVVFFCLSFFVSSSGLIFLTPQKAEAQAYVPVWETGNNLYMNTATQNWTGELWWKEFVGDGVVWTFVKELVKDAVIDAVLTEVSDLFGGNVPAFVTDPFNYIKDLEKEVAQIALNDILNGANLSDMNSLFGTDIMAILTDRHLGNANNRINKILSPTIESVVDSDGNFAQFKNGNFYQGGWAGFFSLTQNAKNNPHGSYFLTEQAITEAQQERESAVLNELSWGNGFFSDRDGSGIITLPGKALSDQLNEVLGNELRTLEHADEITEALALLAGRLIGDIFNGGLSGGGSFTAITPQDEMSTPSSPDDLGPDIPGGGNTISIDGGVPVLDIEDGSFLANAGALRGINLSNSDRMEMQVPTNYGSDSTIKVGASNEVSIPSLTFVRATGGTVDLGWWWGGGPFEPAGEVITLNNVTVQNPIFGTRSNSVAQNTGAVSNAKVIETAGFQADATGAHLTNVTLTLDSDASNDSDLQDAVITEGTGTSITSLTNVSVPSPTSGSFPGDILRGGSTGEGVITLNNVYLLGGTVTTSSGATYTISNPSDNLYCSTLATCNYNQSISGITGTTLKINDSRDAWAIKSIVWDEPREATLTGGFEVYGGTVIGY